MRVNRDPAVDRWFEGRANDPMVEAKRRVREIILAITAWCDAKAKG